MQRIGAIAPCLALVLAACGGAVSHDEAEPRAAPGATTTTLAALDRAIDPAKELVITDLSVIEAAAETSFDPLAPSGVGARGAWSFGRLVHNMLPKHRRDDASLASRYVFDWLRHWETDASPNADAPPSLARTRVRDEVTNPWKRASGCDPSASDESCTLDMSKAPFRLISVLYRPDLRVLESGGEPGSGGEGRFVFQLLSAVGESEAATSKKLTVIFEYSLPIQANAQILNWSNRFHALGALPFGPEYNRALVALTNDFSGPDVDHRRPNGNGLNQLRTNELRFVFPAPGVDGRRWELREFHLGAGGLQQTPVAQEPSRAFDSVPRPVGSGARGAELGDFLVANAAAVTANTFRIPDAWLANSSLVGSRFPAWGDTGLKNPDGTALLRISDSTGAAVPESLRHAFAIQTCAGCHRHETNTRSFLHLTDRRALDPLDPNDNANLPAAPTPGSERQTVISSFLAAEIAAPSASRPTGGERYADYAQLLVTKASDLQEKRGLRACASRR